MHVSADIMTSFSKNSEVRKSFELVNKKLGGANPLYIIIDGGHPDAFKEPANLKTVRELQSWLDRQPVILWQICLGVFIGAWIGQFIGHLVEGKRPAFFKDLQFLMIGPLWLLASIYRRLGIRY